MRMLATAGLVLLTLEASPASATDDPARLLTLAVEKFQTCRYQISAGRERTDSHEDAGLLKLKESDRGMATKLSIPAVFRDGRFALEDKGAVLLNRRDARLINFSPQPEDKRLKRAPNEDRDIARVLNELSGTLYIDAESGRFIQIEARLRKPYSFLSFKKLFPVPVTMSEVSLTVKPESETNWKPTQLVVEFDGHGPEKLGKPLRRHEMYTVELRCTD